MPYEQHLIPIFALKFKRKTDENRSINMQI